MKRPLAALGLAAVLAFPLSACGNDAPARVPRIVGLDLRRAEQQLASLHLRWRMAPGTQIYARALAPNQHTSMDDIPVTGQRPAAGTSAVHGTVITITTPCTGSHPCS
jgi:hypothetical protein